MRFTSAAGYHRWHQNQDAMAAVGTRMAPRAPDGVPSNGASSSAGTDANRFPWTSSLALTSQGASHPDPHRQHLKSPTLIQAVSLLRVPMAAAKVGLPEMSGERPPRHINAANAYEIQRLHRRNRRQARHMTVQGRSTQWAIPLFLGGPLAIWDSGC
ncbi:hypothetical protein HPB50_008256 [Hyalomma asiaticum]|uniref:Uncharacterized protein n=1 Tax=Hyalomma asiaticum TaxID=266040 RepID=A0ACB7T8W1_HYAAI|nr:hypothetical protein HPB50_008256 [Hyalomma asiaticum]